MTDDPSCAIPATADLSRLTVVKLRCRDFPEAMKQTNDEANRHLGEHMLLSWYDRDRDLESPQHSSECHAASAVPGYVDYGFNQGATLKVDIEKGRFVFFHVPVDL
ncbi:MAG: AF1514 family protein [Pseudomonadota bacterium]